MPKGKRKSKKYNNKAKFPFMPKDEYVSSTGAFYSVKKSWGQDQDRVITYDLQNGFFSCVLNYDRKLKKFACTFNGLLDGGDWRFQYNTVEAAIQAFRAPLKNNA